MNEALYGPPASPPAKDGGAGADGGGVAPSKKDAGETPAVHGGGPYDAGETPAVHEGGHSGWRSRGYLPHCDDAGLVQHIVFGLADALPRRAPHAIRDPIARAKWADTELDRAYGSRLLGGPHLAEIVEESLLARRRAL